MATSRICSIPDCDKPAVARGWCSVHYQRWYAHGDPLVRKCAANGEVERYFNEVVLKYEGDDCLFWPYARITNGYPTMGGNGSTQYVHRRVCEEVYGPPPSPDYDTAHSCGKGHLACVAKKHLSWKTRSDNLADQITHGTRLRGEKQNGAKLTKEDVYAIRALKGKMLQREIGELYGVSRQAIGNIHTGRRWEWLFGNST